jgi:predicted Ser/Thr protein kinase
VDLNAQLAPALRNWLANDELREAALLSAGYQGSAYLYAADVAGKPVKLVIKRAAQGFFSGWFHRLMLRREASVYVRMADVAGVPHSLGMLDETWLLLEYIDGESLKTARHSLGNADVFYDRLLQVLHDFHAVGVGHGDLKRKDNVLVTADEHPYVLDFGIAVLRDGGLIDRLMFRLVRRFDYNAWIKVKYRNDYTAISAQDRQWYRPTIVENGIRMMRRLWRTVTFRQVRKRRRLQREADNKN